ncbi:MAG: carboxypeptidase regulatory-like domain-containing protein [Acidobacteria bacterium]|nr:carboxypeptidase regulatory-like domain-containing protein [Acidobacteriota bacterium]
MQPNSFARCFWLFILAAFLSALVSAQTRQSELQRDLRPRNCSIQGRVVINGQPSVNVQVNVAEIPTDKDSSALIRQSADGSIAKTTFSAKTDAEGRYRFMNLPGGKYSVSASSNAFVSVNGSQDNKSKTVTLDSGESRENVDFTLVRGGVITGQITDAENRPIISQSVQFFSVIAIPNAPPQIQRNPGRFNEKMTDDRGVYRIYGLTPGNYIIGAGGDTHRSSGKHTLTFYPDATTDSQAKIITVKAGEEVTGINIRLGASGKTFVAIGRVTESETGKPVPNVDVSCSMLAIEGQDTGNDGGGSGTTDKLGNFRITGLKPGKYGAMIQSGWMETTDFYNEPASFEITDGDVSGVEIKALRGGTISGVGVIEDSNDPAAKSKLAQTTIFAYSEPDSGEAQTGQSGSNHQTTLKADGSFLLTGVAPGNVSIQSYNFRERSLCFMRVERGGAEVGESFKIAKGEKVTDVRLVFAAGSGVIRGQVQAVSNQQLPSEFLSVQATLVGNKTGVSFSGSVDEKGRFTLSDLPTGEYELWLMSYAPNPDGKRTRQTLTKKRITVATGSEQSVTLLYDPNNPIKEGQ